MSAADEEQLAFATAQGRVLVTQDQDFLVLNASGVPHAGMFPGLGLSGAGAQN